jgi:hypothetical protein
MFLPVLKGEGFMARLYTISDTRREDEADLSEGTDLMSVKSVVCVPLIRKSKIRGLT